MTNAAFRGDSIESVILETMQAMSLEILREYAGDKSFEFVPLSSELNPTNWKVVTLIMGPDLKIILRAHFSDESGRQFAQRAYARSAMEISSIEAHGFMRELCNLIAGKMKGSLENNGFNTTLSVPCVTIDTLQPGSPIGKLWTAGRSQGPQVIFNTTLELNSDKALSLSHWEPLSPHLDSHVEFLWPTF